MTFSRSKSVFAWAVACLVPGVLALGAVGCGGAGSAGRSAGIIQVDGSSTVFLISEAVAEEFQRATPGARVTVGISGTGGGFKRFCRGEIDISDASRPISPVEVEACAEAGIEFIELPIAYDGIAVVVHPDNTWARTMTVSELRRLWEPEAQGRIMRWNQVRPEWPDREVRLFGAGIDSGTFDYFTEAIVGREKASRGDFTSSEDDNVLVQGVANDEMGLGFFGYAYYEENASRLALVAVADDRDGEAAEPVAPSPETVRDGTYRPLSRPVFIYVNLDALARPEVEAFVAFYFEHGQDLVREVGYVPLTDREYELTARRLASRVTGTMFREPGAQSRHSLETLLTSAP